MENFDQRVQHETKLQFHSNSQFPANFTPNSRQFPAKWTGDTMYPSVAALLFNVDLNIDLNLTLRPPPSSFPSVLHKDAFLLFRSLCRISMRSIAEDASFSTSVLSIPSSPAPLTSNAPHPLPDDPFAFQSKILSLELVQFIIHHAGPSFRRGDRFIHAIRQYLCQSLLQNCTSNNTNIVGLSLQLFLSLIQHFKQFLRAEIEIFITSVFLRLLQSENSSFDHKMLVLEVLHSVCDDASFLGEIFLNYDCDSLGSDLFRSIVDVLARVAKGKSQRELQASYGHLSSSARLKMTQNDSAITVKGLECLSSIAGSLKKAAHFIDTQTIVPIVKVENDAILEEIVPSALDAIEAFDRKKKRQEEIATGILKFNVKPAAGIQFLVERGHLQSDPRSVGIFLLNFNAKLNKTELGEFLGREPAYQNGYCIKILHEFVDLLDFSGMEIDLAIRHFLSKFRLPGESQKIDRIMEKFAERYFQHAGHMFPSADTAFILSFSIIMLQTDLHNPSVVEEKKMDKASFIRNNRGINNGQDLPEEYLGGIYDRIKASPISLKEDDAIRAKNDLRRPGPGNSFFGASSALNDRMRRDAYSRERETMVRQSEALFKRRNPAVHSPHQSDGKPVSKMYRELDTLAGPCHVRPMFETLWAPLLACCSVVFESSETPVAIQLCLDAFRHAIHLAARLEMPAERDAFVTVLAKFTALHTIESRAIRLKNIEAIQTLISISVKEGDYLMDAWRDILQCISQLAKIQLHGIGAEAEFFGSPASKKSISSPNTMIDDRIAVENGNATRILQEIDALASDRVFSSSMHLNDKAVQEFIQQLCVVSLSECSGISNNRVAIPNADPNASSSFPRVYCLQKLVEVADMNMHTRSRVVWDSMWKVLSRHFTTIGCHENLSVAMYAIDSLKQLSMKFLEREELKDFNFQRLFLTPFEIIMANASSLEIRELVLRCVENMILARVGNIKSGWKTIWAVLRVAAETFDPLGGQKERGIIGLGFQIAKRSLTDHLGRMMDVFVDAVECVLAFAVCQDQGEELLEKSVECVELLEGVCFEQLAVGNVTEKEIGGKRIAFRKKTIGNKRKGEKRYEKSETLELLETEIDAATSRLVRCRAVGIDAGTNYKEVSTGTDAGPNGEPVMSVSTGIDAGTGGEERFGDTVSGTGTVGGLLRFQVEERNGLEGGVYTDSAAHLRLWWPVLTALATLASDRRLDVRWMALHALFDALKKHGLQFSGRLWSMIFRGILIPLLHEIQLAEAEDTEEPRLKVPTTLERCWKASQTNAQTRAEHCLSPTNAETQWRNNTLVSATSTMCLERLLDLFGAFYDRIGFLPEVIFVLGNCMEEKEELAVAAATSLEQMLVVHGTKFPENVWGLIADELCAVMMRVTPTWTAAPVQNAVISMYPDVVSQLELQFTSNDKSAEDRIPDKTHLIVLLALQKIFGRVLSAFVKGKVRLVDAHANNLSRCLKQSYESCEFLNRNFQLRRQLATKGWEYGVDGRDDVAPNVLLQEVEGKLACGKVLVERVLQNKKRDEARRELTILLRASMAQYLVWCGVWSAEGMEERTGRRAMQADAEVCVMRYQRFWVSIFPRLAHFPKNELERYLVWLFPLLNDFIKVDDVEVRKALVSVYQQGILQFLPIEHNQ
uniref:Brefeldin Ainhibited guanine nucleotideexchange protein putative n=1 Tax=Albugo laibachii Nc14 TaxID=890382 RepID=F0WM19_9STRA|nr:brefeldin Ainhibited guanine nucleotideexchange protein putative [Albugo laibachii Nc14]|eukprot:CCA22346.1 brefeldin Ainhibited guanine nucleotideexchange protein putative [Albugo laibachii Nc14]